MSTTQQGSSGGGTSSRRPERVRRAWSNHEELTLVSVLKDVIAQGWKAENGFRPGYLNRVEALMRKEIPGCDLKAMSHINSRLASWKKQYNSLNQVLSRSGVGFNGNGNHMLDVEDDQWEQIVKMDPSMRGRRYTQWHYYEAWKEIFGRDRATGEQAEDLYEAYTALHGNEEVEVGDKMESDGEANPVATDQESKRDTPGTSDGKANNGISSGKKREMQQEVDPLCELLAELSHATSVRLDKIATRIGVEYEKGEARKEVLKQLGQIAGLTLADKFKLCKLIAFKAERLDIWRGMGNEERSQYVDHLLSGLGV